MNNLNITLCNVLNGSSAALNLYSILQQEWNQGCLMIKTNSLINPNFNQQLRINITYDGYPSLVAY